MTDIPPGAHVEWTYRVWTTHPPLMEGYWETRTNRGVTDGAYGKYTAVLVDDGDDEEIVLTAKLTRTVLDELAAIDRTSS